MAVIFAVFIALFFVNESYGEFQDSYSFGEEFKNLPWGDVAYLNYGGSLSDYKFRGKELFLDDRPFVLEVDGVALRGASSDRIYFLRLPTQNIDSVNYFINGGLSGSERRVVLYQQDNFIASPLSQIRWENGPFGWNAVQFAFSRKISSKAALSLSLNKIFQSDGSTYSNGQPEYYSHPEAILGIYRSLLKRDESEFVSEGLKLSGDFSRWNLAVNLLPVDWINMCLNYELMRDAQIDGRPYGNTLINLSSRRVSDRLTLRANNIRKSLITWNVTAYGEMASLSFPKEPRNGFLGAQYIKQGNDAYGMIVKTSISRGKTKLEIKTEVANDNVWEENIDKDLWRSLVAHSFNREFTSSIFTTMLNIDWAVRMDSRLKEGTLPTSISPRIGIHTSSNSIPIDLRLAIGSEKRLPEPAVQFLPNKRMNLVASDLNSVSVIKSDYAEGALTAKMGKFICEYAAELYHTKAPFLMKPVQDINGLHWIYSQDVLDKDRRIANMVKLSFITGSFSQSASAEYVVYGWKRPASVDSSFNTFALMAATQVNGLFVNNRLKVDGCFNLKLRPDVWAIDPWLSAQPKTLKWHLDTEINMGFTIKKFHYYAVFQNLGNYVIRYEPGYYLPGPAIKWGINWQFGG